MTPSAELRAAAARIREVAGKATPGPWVSLGRGDRIVRDPEFTPVALDYVVDEPLEANPANGDHIALFDPIVAELVAEWLENEAGRHAHLGEQEVSVWDRPYMTPEFVAAQPCIKLARAILGSQP